MPFELPSLPYAKEALEPHIDATTMDIHHGKHHATYVNNLNNALASAPELAGMSLEQLLANNCAAVPTTIRTAVKNNGGGHSNHSLFWTVMCPGGQREPNGDLADAINGTFGNFAKFQETFAAAGVGRFGSGWAWLVKNSSGSLQVFSTANQDSPLMTGHLPLLGLDVWEHAYYLHYQNRRPDYIKAWWSVVNWAAVEERFNS